MFSRRVAFPFWIFYFQFHADGLGGGERAAADEDGKAAEERLLGGTEQIMAPGDRLAEGLVAWRVIGEDGAEQVEPLLETGEQVARRQQPDPRGGHLDRQRQAIEARA